MEYVLAMLIIGGFASLYFKNRIKEENNSSEYKKRILELEKSHASKDEIIKNMQKDLEVINAKMSSFEQIKTEKIQIEERLKIVETEKNNLRKYIYQNGKDKNYISNSFSLYCI